MPPLPSLIFILKRTFTHVSVHCTYLLRIRTQVLLVFLKVLQVNGLESSPPGYDLFCDVQNLFEVKLPLLRRATHGELPNPYIPKATSFLFDCTRNEATMGLLASK